MQVKTIRYSRLVSTGQFENESYEMIAELSHNENPEQELATLKNMVDSVIKENQDNFNAEISNDPPGFVIIDEASNVPDEAWQQLEESMPDDDPFTEAALKPEPEKDDFEKAIDNHIDEMQEEPAPNLQETVEKYGIKKGSELEEDNNVSPKCNTCGGNGTVPDEESEDPLDTKMCPDC